MFFISVYQLFVSRLTYICLSGFFKCFGKESEHEVKTKEKSSLEVVTFNYLNMRHLMKGGGGFTPPITTSLFPSMICVQMFNDDVSVTLLPSYFSMNLKNAEIFENFLFFLSVFFSSAT